MGCVTIEPAGTYLDGGAFAGAVSLLGCLEVQLEQTVGGRVCRACVYPGVVVPMDFCSVEDCGPGGGHGMAAVRVANIQLMQEQTSNRCAFAAAQMAVTYEMVVFRCVHTVVRRAGRVEVPSCDELASDVAIVMDDAAAMRKALKCCFAAPPAGGGCSPRFTNIGPWMPRGPLGGCAGGVMPFTVVMNDCGCGDA